MPVVWEVTLARFKKEYFNHVAELEHKFVNWMVDPETETVFAYITASHSPEIYCYRYFGLAQDMPFSLREMLRDEGQVLGVMTLEDNNDQVSDDVSSRDVIDMFRQIQTGMIDRRDNR
jgi:hypothetical protein|tara:strand:+ start:6063 stop:6416 length:354 start_codon:yes stop_codon:yes gene_type:complete